MANEPVKNRFAIDSRVSEVFLIRGHSQLRSFIVNGVQSTQNQKVVLWVFKEIRGPSVLVQPVQE